MSVDALRAELLVIALSIVAAVALYVRAMLRAQTTMRQIEVERQRSQLEAERAEVAHDAKLNDLFFKTLADVRRVEAERANLLMTMGRLSAQVDLNTEQIRMLNDQLAEARRENDALRAENARLQAAIEGLTAENVRLQARVAELEARVPPQTTSWNVEFLHAGTSDE